MENDAYLVLRAPSDLVASLKRVAEAGDRTLSQEARRAVRAHIDANLNDERPASRPGVVTTAPEDDGRRGTR